MKKDYIGPHLDIVAVSSTGILASSSDNERRREKKRKEECRRRERRERERRERERREHYHYLYGDQP